MVIPSSGCQRKVSLSSWQDSVQQSIRESANGDPLALRDVAWSGSDKGFVTFSHPTRRRSTDAVGVLLAHRKVAGRPWFFFLVALRSPERVHDVRVAALSAAGGQNQWRFGQRQANATRTYRRFRDRAWRRRFQGRTAAPDSATVFPAPDDRFRLEIEGNLVSATHVASGARWELDLVNDPETPPDETTPGEETDAPDDVDGGGTEPADPPVDLPRGTGPHVAAP